MSKISLSPNASGTGTFTIQSPAGNTNRTFTLPDADGELSVGGGGFTYVAVTGATQDLDLDEGNFFDAGVQTSDTTLTFSNVPTEASWSYFFKAGIDPSTTWDLTNINANNKLSLNISDQDSLPRGLAFNADGTRMYTAGGANDSIHQYDLGVPWIVTSAIFRNSFDCSANSNNPMGIDFKPDGTIMYLIGYDTDTVAQYSLSTAFDATTATYVKNFSVQSQSTFPYGVNFLGDGTKMYVASASNIYEYHLSTAWDVATASYSGTILYQASKTMTDCFMKPDGTKLYVLEIVSDFIQEYTLSTAGVLSSATLTDSHYIGSDEGNAEGIWVHPDGSSIYILGYNEDNVFQYPVGTAFTLTVPSSIENFSASALINGQSVVYDFLSSDGGTTVKLIGEEVF